MVVAAGLAIIGYHQSFTNIYKINLDNKSLVAFRTGAGVYVGTFILGNNWDYRLIFLTFTVPVLARLVRAGVPWLRWVSAILVGGILLSCWHISIYHICSGFPLGSPACVLLDECANWIVFLGLSLLFGSSLPRWWPTDPLAAI